MKTKVILILFCIFASITYANYAPRNHVDHGLFDQRLPRQLVMVGDANKVVFYSQNDSGDWLWWSMRAADTIVTDANYVWPDEPNDVNSVLYIKSIDGTDYILDWGPFDANAIIYDVNGEEFTFPDKTPWNVIFVDANGFPITDDPNHFTYYQPSGYFGVGTDYISGQTYANNYIQVYTLLDFEPNLFNVTIGRGSDDTTYGPNNTTIGHGAGDSMLNSYRNTLGGKDSGTSLTGGTDNSFWGYQAGKNVTQSGTIRDEAYVIANNDDVVWFDKNWNVLSYEDLAGEGSASNTCASVISTSEGLCISGYATAAASGPCMTRWTTDLNSDEEFFVPDAGWSYQQRNSSGQLSEDESYLYTKSESPYGMYKFDMSDGSQVWFLSTSTTDYFDLYSDDSFIVGPLAGSRWNKYDKDANLLDTYYAFMGWTGMKGVVYDEDDDRIYACGAASHDIPPLTYFQVKARNWDGTNYDMFSWDNNNSDQGTGILKIGDYIYVTAQERNQAGIGGAWASVYKLDKELNLVASYDPGRGSYGLFLDHDGNIVVVAGNHEGGDTGAGIWVLDTDLNYISNQTYNTDPVGVGGLTGTKIPYADANEGSKNTAIGSQALYGATGAEPNEATAGGYKSLYSVTTPNQPTAYGAHSAENVTTADRGIYLGPYAGYNQTTLDDRFILDNRDRTSAADEITDSLFYGYIAADPNDSWLNINVGELNLNFVRLDVNDVNVANDVTIGGNLTLNDSNEGGVLFLDSSGRVVSDFSDFLNNFSSEPNIVSHYRFEPGALTTDSEGTNTLIASGSPVADTASKKEGESSVDIETGDSDYYYIADGSLSSDFPCKSGTSNNVFTITGWFNCESATDNQFITGKYNHSTNKRCWGIAAYPTSNYLWFGWGYNGGSSVRQYTCTITNGLDIEKWYFFKIVYDDPNNVCNAYVYDATNAVWQSSNNSPTDVLNIEDAQFYVGRQGGGNNFDGNIDEICIFNRVVSDADAEKIMAGTFGDGIYTYFKYVDANDTLFVEHIEGMTDVNSPKYYVGDSTYYITTSGSNMTLTDPTVGTKTLKQLGSPTYLYIKATAQAEGDLHLSDGTNWPTSKAFISMIRIATSASDWDLYILQNDNGYAADDATIPKLMIANCISGNANLKVDVPYDDEDDSDEVHLYYVDNSGANTADIYIMGFSLN